MMVIVCSDSNRWHKTPAQKENQSQLWTAEGHQCASFSESAFGDGSGVQHERSENEACGGLRSGVAVSARSAPTPRLKI